MTGTRLELVWPNKDKFLLVPKGDDGKPVWVERDHPAAAEVRISDYTDAIGDVSDANPYSDNLMFQGDSLDVLRILNEVPEYRREYRGKVKLIYIDPPFNTGQTFTHYDDWMEHSTWLSFMRDRLLLMKDLLSPDGSIWVHLDDAEVHRMRCLMDEVFGTQRFAATIVWQKTTSARNDAKKFSTDQDCILVYTCDGFAPNGMPRTAASERAYSNPDNDPRGPWREGDYKAGSGYLYPIRHPRTGEDVLPPEGQFWRYPQETHERHVAENAIWWGRTGNYRFPKAKRFRTAVGDTVVPQTLWLADAVDTTRRAKTHIKDLFPNTPPFDTPKPERLIERVIHIGSKPGEVVLDVFAGSGTTAAVAQKMGRRWVTSELSPSTLATFTQPRLRKVVANEDPGGITESAGWTGGGGFRVVTVGPSMYETTPLGVMLADWATNGRFARAVAGQLGFEFEPDAAPFCGSRGRMRLAVLDGAVGVEETRQLVYSLGEKERVTIVAQVILPGVEEFLRESSRGSRVQKAPRDLLIVRRGRKRKGEGTPA